MVARFAARGNGPKRECARPSVSYARSRMRCTADQGPVTDAELVAVPGLQRITWCCAAPGTRALVERLDLDDGGAVVAADPEHGPAAGFVDEDPPDVGALGQQILRDLAGLDI